MANSTYKVSYFNFKGLCEYIRFTFAYADVDFEDNRIAMADWPALKEKQPYGSLPVLDYDGKKLTQSVAICRFLGKKFGLVAEDPFTEALLEAVVDNIRDIRAKMKQAMQLKTPELQKESAEETKYLFTRLEPIAADGYFYGSKPTWVDIYFAGLMETVFDYIPDLLDNYPNLKGICDKIKSKDSVQKYIKNRPAPEKMP